MYPYGDWTNFIPNGLPNYNDLNFISNEKYFCRTFQGNLNLKFGGIFEIKGITKNDLLDNRLNILISCDNGENWFSLKHIRGTKSSIISNDYSVINVTGIMTNVEECNDGIKISWMYPGTICSSNDLYFKLCMKQTSTFCIKSISLLNNDGTKDW